MQIDLNCSTLAKTTLCQQGFACTLGSTETICEVRELVLGEVLLIACAAKLPCKYSESFGSWAICTCPTRKEIHDRFGI